MEKYNIIRTKRKTLSIEVNEALEVIVRSPIKTEGKEIAAFVNSNTGWIDEQLLKMKKRLSSPMLMTLTVMQENELRERAKLFLPKRVRLYSEKMQLFPAGVKITSAQKRFGSCSAKNNLCFSFRLMMYDLPEIDYVIVHELAHIKHKNHSGDFYKLIEAYLPNYRQAVKMLKQ